MKPYLIVDSYIEPPGGAHNLVRLLDGAPHRTVRSTVEPLPGSSEPYRALLLTGSAASVVDDDPWTGPLLDLLADAASRRVPVLGICYGHQAIARALFGRAAVRRAPVAEIGFREIEVTDDRCLLAGVGRPLRTFLSHFDEVLPVDGLRVLARTADCSVQAYQVVGRPVWGIQFHPEMGSAEIERILRDKERDRPELGVDADRELAGAVDGRPVIGRIFANFLERALAPESTPCAT